MADDSCFDQEVRRIQSGFQMLDSIERKLRGFLGAGSESASRQSNGFE